ncbi:hypothetical protein WMF31_07505 [Sorangium sp. So ce1036]|uniref:PEGA domain-containing protein n=1 Tax=Sorangium sp. So ce1036 TaxID=3133328 RepID=UPI003F085BF2
MPSVHGGGPRRRRASRPPWQHPTRPRRPRCGGPRCSGISGSASSNRASTGKPPSTWGRASSKTPPWIGGSFAGSRARSTGQSSTSGGSTWRPPRPTPRSDGEPIGTGATVHELFVAPGTYTLRARLSGHGEVSQRVEVAAGRTVGAALQLARLPDAPAPEPVARKSEPVAPAAAPAARAAAPGPWASWPGTLRIAGIAVTTATVSAGAVFMLRASRIDGDLGERIDGLHRDPAWTSGACRAAPQPPACPELHRLREQRDRAGAIGTALVATGAVVGAATAASFFVDLSSQGSTQARSGLRVVPVMATQQVGVMALGLW